METAKSTVPSVTVLDCCQPSVMNAKARGNCLRLLAPDQLNATCAMAGVLSRANVSNALVVASWFVKLARDPVVRKVI